MLASKIIKTEKKSSMSEIGLIIKKAGLIITLKGEGNVPQTNMQIQKFSCNNTTTCTDIHYANLSRSKMKLPMQKGYYNNLFKQI